jgi:chromosome segregation protein
MEAALAGKSDSLVVSNTKLLLGDTELCDGLKGRVNIICADRIKPFVDTEDLSDHKAIIGRAVEFVRFDSKHTAVAWELLGHTLIVSSVQAAMKLSGRLSSKYNFVTPDGKLFDGQCSISIGPLGKRAGLISRKSRLGELKTEIAGISHNIREMEERLDKSHQQNEHLDKLCKELRTAVYEANTEKVDAESKLRLIEHNVDRLKNEQPILVGEIETLETDISQTVQKEHDSKEKLQELDVISTERNSHIDELEKKLALKRAELETKAATQTELRIEIGQVSEQRKSLRQRIAMLDGQLQHGRMAIQSAQNELTGSDEQIVQTERGILASESAVSALYAEKETAQKTSVRMHKEVEQLRDEKIQREATLKEKRKEQSELEEVMHQIELQLSQLSVKNEDLTQRVSEELSLDLAESYENFVQEDIDWEQVRQEIGDLRGKIERLGNVNVDAINEQQALEERYEFLAKQVEDLNDSKKQLEQLIAKINKESRDKFAVTFEEVRLNFQKVFRKLFGGGKADIILEDPDDVLESGIEIVAQPPGKETRVISLLSGGEKTMTAIALLFAVFKSKPSPFCILDEVDAALDEANNERFNMIVQDFESNSQFIIITHSKRTMSIADMLFGVTMQTRGVSKKISVQFDQVGDDGNVEDEEEETAAVA